MNNHTLLKQSVELISGAYSSRLWDGLCDICEIEESPSRIYGALEALHNVKRDEEAFSLIQALHDLAGLDLPDTVAAMNSSDTTRTSYITELLLDIEDMI